MINRGRKEAWEVWQGTAMVRTASSDSYLLNHHVHTKKESKVSSAGRGQPAQQELRGLREIKSECLDQRASRKVGRSVRPVDPLRNFCSLDLHQETFRWLGPRLCVMWTPLKSGMYCRKQGKDRSRESFRGDGDISKNPVTLSTQKSSELKLVWISVGTSESVQMNLQDSGEACLTLCANQCSGQGELYMQY